MVAAKASSNSFSRLPFRITMDDGLCGGLTVMLTFMGLSDRRRQWFEKTKRASYVMN
jgi:hypothetical protein